MRLPDGQKPNNDWYKLQANGLLIFDGKTESYSSFRNSFLNAVHVQPIDISHKCCALIKAIQTIPRCAELIRIAEHNQLGYSIMICNLESYYGGVGNLIYEERALLKDSRRYPKLGFTSDKLEDLEKLVIVASRYVIMLVSQGRETDTISSDFTNLISEKLTDTYDMFYGQWIQATERPRCGLSMIDWLSELRFEKQAKSKERTLDNAKPSSGYTQPKAQATASSSTNRSKPNWNRNGSNKPSSIRRAYNANETMSDQDYESSPSEDEEGNDDNWLVDEDGQTCHTFFFKKTKSKAPRTPEKCPFCGEIHWIVNCPKYMKMTPAERRKQLFEMKRCYRCLGKDHALIKCPSQRTCKSCKEKHHTSLHGADPKSAPSSAKSRGNQSSELPEETPAEQTEQPEQEQGSEQ